MKVHWESMFRSVSNVAFLSECKSETMVLLVCIEFDVTEMRRSKQAFDTRIPQILNLNPELAIWPMGISTGYVARYQGRACTAPLFRNGNNWNSCRHTRNSLQCYC